MNEAADAYLRAGHLLEEKGRTDEARACYDEAARADPASAEAWWDKARILINIYELMSGHPRNVEAYVEVHEYLLKAGERGHDRAFALDEALLPFFKLAINRLRET